MPSAPWRLNALRELRALLVSAIVNVASGTARGMSGSDFKAECHVSKWCLWAFACSTSKIGSSSSMGLHLSDDGLVRTCG